jgi:transcriptional regulator with XRE-family HTH domain
VRSRLEDVLTRRLRELAKDKHIPLSHVADRAGVSRGYFWLLLVGENSATLAVVQRIADALGVEPIAFTLLRRRCRFRLRRRPAHPVAARRRPGSSGAGRRNSSPGPTDLNPSGPHAS